MSRLLKNKNFVITQRYKAGTHNGIDLLGANNTTDYVLAHSDGTVYKVQKGYYGVDRSTRGYGNYVFIHHDNGYSTVYAHLKYGTVTVNVGDKVIKGQVIGYIGNTGYSFGEHLHFEVRKNMAFIDPTPYLNADLPLNPSQKYAYIASIYTKTTEKETLTDLNLRSKPTINSNTLKTIPKKTKIKIVEENVSSADGYTWDKIEI